VSVDYHLYTQDERPVTTSELATAAEAGGDFLFILNSFHDWGDYDLAGPAAPLESDVIVCLVASSLPDASKLVEELRARSEHAVRAAVESNGIRICELSTSAGPDWQDEGEAEELKQVYGGKYVAYRKKTKLHYLASGGPMAIPDLDRVLKLIESLRGGLYEDPQSSKFTIDGKETAWPREAMADARITDRRCVKCKRPLPSYRKTCRWCGSPAIR
jgi:hypothetical protein